MQPQEFPPCYFKEFHKDVEIPPPSFIAVREVNGTYDPRLGVVNHIVKGICSDCLWRVIETTLRPKVVVEQ